MTRQGFEAIANNCDILMYIYKMLNFEDQLRLSCVSVPLKSVFENYIRKKAFHTLAVYEKSTDYVVSSKTDGNRVIVNRNVCHEFMQNYAGEVQELIVYSTKAPDLRQFRNLTSLRYDWCENPLRDLQVMAENLANLQSLHLHRCFKLKQGGRIMIDETLMVETLLKMNNLKRLCLDNDRNIPALKYRNFHQLVTRLKLEYFKFDAYIPPDEEAAATDTNRSVRHPAHLQELAVETSLEPRKWSTNFSLFLWNFENLKVLSVRIIDEVSDEILNILADTCKHLKMLTIRSSTFKNIQLFALAPSVTELRLLCCRGLSQHNLQQLLTLYGITKFTSKATRYLGTFQDFPISPHIQSLLVDGIDITDFKSAYVHNHNLKHLAWDNSGGHINYRPVVTDVHLASCLNLETLELVGSQIRPVTTLLQLQHLHKLTMPYLKMPLQWSYITALLKHPPLRELIIERYREMLFPETSLEVPPSKGFTTNVKCLKINAIIIELAFEFWLDLFSRNTKMTLVCLRLTSNRNEFLWKLINHQRFPRTLRTLDVFGFATDCSELRRDFDDTMENLEHFRTNMNRIILRGK